jgi:hypothetical protein
MIKVNDIIRLDDEYPNFAEYCNQNGLMIVEIEPDELGRRFEIQERPQPSNQDIILETITSLKQELEKYKEDVEQVELFGMERADYEQKKTLCAEIILELRELEQKLK